MNPLRSFFTYIANGILSLRKNFHTLRIYKSEKFVDFALSDGPGGSVVLEIKTNDINDIVKITASLEAAGYCIFKKSVNFKDSVTFEGSIIADSTVEIASHLTCGGVTTLKSAIVERELKAGWLEIDGRVECGSIDAPNGWGSFKYLNVGGGISNFNGQAQFHHSINCDNEIVASQITAFQGLNVFHDGDNVFEVNELGDVTAKSLEVGGGLNLLKITLRDGPFSSVACDFNMPNTTDYIHIWNRLQIHNSLHTTSSFEAEGYSTFHDGMTVQKGLKLRNLPTADPHVSDQVWNDGGTLKVSAG